MATVTLSSIPSERVALRRLWWAGPLTIGGAVIANVLTRYIAGMLVISRLARQPIRLFRIIATVALLLSLVPGIALLVSQAMPGTNGLTVGLLMLLHVVPALVTVGLLTR